MTCYLKLVPFILLNYCFRHPEIPDLEMVNLTTAIAAAATVVAQQKNMQLLDKFKQFRLFRKPQKPRIFDTFTTFYQWLKGRKSLITKQIYELPTSVNLIEVSDGIPEIELSNVTFLPRNSILETIAFSYHRKFYDDLDQNHIDKWIQSTLMPSFERDTAAYAEFVTQAIANVPAINSSNALILVLSAIQCQRSILVYNLDNQKQYSICGTYSCEFFEN